MGCCTSRWTSLILFIVGSLLVILGCTIKWGIFPVVMDKMIGESLKLSEDNKETWDAFVRLNYCSINLN